MSSVQIFTGKHYVTGKTIGLKVRNGIIERIEDVNEIAEVSWIAPGLVDLQVNGFMGINMNHETLDIKDVQKLMQEMFRFGVTYFYPTLITNDIERLKHHLSVIADAYENTPKEKNNIGGIHLEGPFISKDQGPRGAHPLEFVLTPNWELFESLQESARGLIRMITLSPEYEGAPYFIKKCVASGVIVSIGHTAATPEQIHEAVQAGARLSTHLGNACHANLPRHHNYIWQQLAEDDLWVSLIADGFHLPENLLKVFLKVKEKNAFLVSDTTSFAGLSPGTYSTLIGNEVVLDAHGKLYMKDNPDFLAGSAQSLIDCVNFLSKNTIKTLSQAWNLGSIQPMRFLDKEPYGLVEGASADLVFFQQESNEIVVQETAKNGEIVYSGSL